MFKLSIPAFMTAADAKQLENASSKRGFHLWNLMMLLFSSAGICAAVLILAIGMYEVDIFLDYFRNPVIFILNYIPILLFQLLMYCLFGKQWLAFLLSSFVFITSAIGNFYKLKFRSEAFCFSDISMIGTAMNVAGDYDMTPNARIILSICAVLIGTVFLLLFAKGRPSRRVRIAAALAVVLSVYPLWNFVYSSKNVYGYVGSLPNHIDELSPSQTFAQRGFVYPFIYSISETGLGVPDNYDPDIAKALLSPYTDADIPGDRKVNVIVFQLESFADLRKIGLDGISDETYSYYDELLEQSYHGILYTDVYAGGTIVTEHSVMAGDTDYFAIKSAHPSYIRYFNAQGYSTIGSHPASQQNYGRSYANSYLGFDSYRYAEDTYFVPETGKALPKACDNVLFPTVLEEYFEYAASGTPVLSYNVTLQGHSPYNSSSYDHDTEFWYLPDCNEGLYNLLNNYLYSVHDTLEHIRDTLSVLSADDTPVVVLFYGDHKPLLNNDDASVWTEYNIPRTAKTLEGYQNHNSTEYLIWANDAAKERLGSSFTGEGPDISACYLMNVLFEQLGWTGDARLQYMSELMQQLPLINNKNGYYLVDGEIVSELSGSYAEAVSGQKMVQYYLKQSVKNNK